MFLLDHQSTRDLSSAITRALPAALFAFGRRLNSLAYKPGPGVAGRAALVTVLLVAGVLFADYSRAQGWTGTDIARRVVERPEGDIMRRVIDITLTDRRGRTRERSALVLKRNDAEARSTRFTYLEPKSLYETTFLSVDYRDAQRGDDRWLYLPATRKVRRIPASDRGDYFLGTDFTYEDIQSELKLPLSDYDFTYESPGDESGVLLRLSGTVKTPEIGRELGYGGFDALVNSEDWLFREIRFRDTQNELLKTVTVHAVQRDGDIWTATDIEVVNHQTGHETRFRYREVAYPEDLPQDSFEPASLRRGLPASLLP